MTKVDDRWMMAKVTRVDDRWVIGDVVIDRIRFFASFLSGGHSDKVLKFYMHSITVPRYLW